MIVTDERVAAFVAQRLSVKIVPPFVCFGIERDGEIIGGVVFNCFTGADIEATVAGNPGVFGRNFIRHIGNYVFNSLGCLRISVTTENPSVVRLVERMGGQIEGLKRDQFGRGRDGFILGILEHEWRFK